MSEYNTDSLINDLMDTFIRNELIIDDSSDQLIKSYSNNRKFLKNPDDIKLSLIEIETILKQITFAYDEFYYFLSIRQMIDYIIEHIEKYIKYASFIYSLLSVFYDLLIQKRETLNNNTSEVYKKAYENFEIVLDEKEDYFYNEIFDYTHEHDKLIDEVTNIFG